MFMDSVYIYAYLFGSHASLIGENVHLKCLKVKNIHGKKPVIHRVITIIYIYTHNFD